MTDAIQKTNTIKKWIVGGFALGLGGVLGYGLLSFRQEDIQVAALRKQNASLQAALNRTRFGNEAASAEPPAAPAVTAPKVVVHERRVPGEQVPVTSAETAAELDRVKQANKSLEYETEVAKANAASIAAESARWQAATKDLEEKLAASNRLAEALQTQFRAASERISRLQLDTAEAKRESARAAESAAKGPAQSKAVDDLMRRRDGYIASILRRYREITDQYRTVAQRADRPSDLAGGEVSRIQSAIALAEDDLRQIESLNAQAKRVLAEANSRK